MGRVAAAMPLVLALTAALLAVRAVVPAPAHAVDLFPVDDWLGDGIKKAGDVVLGPLKLGAKEIARLLATIVGALADLLVPNSFIRAGLDGIRWLVQLPPLGESTAVGGSGGRVRMPHLAQLREVLSWIGLSLLPLGLVIAGGRAVLAPTVGGESPAEVFGRVVVVGVALIAYDWVWGAVIGLSRLLTEAVLGLPWVDDGVEKMLQTLVIGGAAGSAVAAEFVIPLLVLIGGTVLLGLLLVRIGLEIAAALLYVVGGLVLGLSVTGFGWRLLYGWLIAATAIVALPLLWSIVFATGAALMLDARPAGGGGFGGFIAQLFNVAAALAVFWIAIKLALGVFRHASGAISTIARTPASTVAGAAAGGGGAGRVAALAQNATPAGLARFSQNLRGRAQMAAAWPTRHATELARQPVQGTQRAASALRDALAGPRAAATGPAVGRAVSGPRPDGTADREPGRGRRAAEASRPGTRAGEAGSDTAASPARGAGHASAARPSAPPRPGAPPPAAPPASTRGTTDGLAGGNARSGPSGADIAAGAAPAPRLPPAVGGGGPSTAPSAGPSGGESAGRPWWLLTRPRKRSDRDQGGTP